MAVDGTWKVVVKSPMGAQEGTLTLKSAGNALSGDLKDAGSSIAVEDGKVDGNKASWSGQMKQPFPMKLEFSVTVSGDEMTGEVKAGSFGSSPLTGKRVV